MKKKILIVSILALILVCAFALCISAEDKIIQLDKCPTLEEIHADREAYVSHLDAYDGNSRAEQDATSVTVLSDLAETPTYYVFPSYYVFTGSTWWVSLSDLNTKIEETGLEGFVPFSVSTGRGKNLSTIRIEVPTYVTAIDGGSKPEGSSNIKEIYFPTKIVVDEETGIEKEVSCITSISGADLFNGCSSLEVIHNTEKMPVGLVGGQANFAWCKKLKEFKIPEGTTWIAQSVFSNCYALESIEIPDTVTSLSHFAFGECTGLKEVTLPNGLTAIGKHAFGGCSSLEIMRFGASFTTFTRYNWDYETFSGCNSLKFVYLPAAFASSIEAKAGDYKSIFGQSSKTVYFVTENDYDKIVEIQNKFITTNANGNIAGASIELYDPTKNYETYQATLTNSVIVYGYSACNAFYNNEHIKAEPTYGFNGDKYISNFCSFESCTRCVDITVKELVDPLFISRGYSTSGDAFMFDIKLDHDAINAYKAIYKEKLGEEAVINYGLVISGDTTIDTLIDSDGVVANNNVLKISFSDDKNFYTNIQIKFNNVTTDVQKALQIHACAYVIEGGEVVYIGDGVASDKSTTISYDKIMESENATEEVPNETEQA